MQPKITASKAQYTESEAAAQLGISPEELRELIRLHIVQDDADAGNVPMTTFQASDLLVLRLLARKRFTGAA
jgi:hypothetical protein